MISVGIIGGSGYTGKYIVKFCNDHPNIFEYVVYANTSAGKSLYDVFPELVGEIDNSVIQNISDIDYVHDLYFLALPHGESVKYVPLLINSNKKVIDLGADFRLDDAKLFNQTYNSQHQAPSLLIQKNYGLAEINDSYEHELIANPGCYPTAALLSTIPIVQIYSEIISSVSTVSYSGLSGAGKKVSPNMLFTENYNSVKAYNVGNHRHEAEIVQELNKFGNRVNYSLTTHLLPVFSGIYSTTIINLSDLITQTEIDNLISDRYKNSTFLRVRETPPELKWVIGTNYCDMNFKCLGNKIIVTAAIDNLIKGAAGQAIQNMNKLFGWDEVLGIKTYREEIQNV